VKPRIVVNIGNIHFFLFYCLLRPDNHLVNAILTAGLIMAKTMWNRILYVKCFVNRIRCM